MAYMPPSLILFGCVFLFLLQGYCSSSEALPKVNISCLIINLKYINCSWTKVQMQKINFTFRTLNSDLYQECPEYLKELDQNVGCRIPLKMLEERFSPFYTKLTVGGNHTKEDYKNLLQRVKLNPPYNVSVNFSSADSEVCMHWVNSFNDLCVENEVRHRIASNKWKTFTSPSKLSYCVSPVINDVTYTFQVRTRIFDYCGASELWSDWTDPVQWSNNTDNNTDNNTGRAQWHVLVIVLSVVLLIFLSVLLFCCERIKGGIHVVLLPVVPDPSKNLQDLFHKYNGNVESWVHISRELKEAFEPDYTESPCVVYEPDHTLENKSAEGPVEQPQS
ncbi:interleukin 2 receptor, gamma b [Trichomycterus rosablanca]|uniref:interleukin 2 receptor, gamma b n=1 Tax=Trichomycterus rosablanca TaxID=2290929 RepID=UPI002F355365